MSNLITNGEFLTLDHWTKWHIGPNNQTYNIENINTGASHLVVVNPPTSLRMILDSRCWHAGVYQSVSVGAFKRVKATVSGRIYDVPAGVPWPGPSDPNGKRFLRIGIDQTGGTSPTSTVVQWEEVGQLYDTFKTISIEALALTNNVTVFVGIENGRDNEWPLFQMTGFLDAVSLVVLDDVEPPPPDPEPEPDNKLGIVSVEDKGTYWRIVEHKAKATP